MSSSQLDTQALIKNFDFKLNQQILLKTLKTLDGRYAFNKVVAQTLKFLVLKNKQLQKSKQNQQFQKTASNVASMISNSRKTFRIGHFLDSYQGLTDALKERKNINSEKMEINEKIGIQKDILRLKNIANYIDIFCGFGDVLNDVADDIYYLGKLEVLSKQMQKFGEKWGTIIWQICVALTIIMNLILIAKIKKEIEQKQQQLEQIQIIESESTDTESNKSNINQENLNDQSIEKLESEIKKLKKKLLLKQVSVFKNCLDCSFCFIDLTEILKLNISKLFDANPKIQVIIALFAGIFGVTKQLMTNQI